MQQDKTRLTIRMKYDLLVESFNSKIYTPSTGTDSSNKPNDIAVVSVINRVISTLEMGKVLLMRCSACA